MALLEGLEGIDWSALGHAYGSAADVPELLRALADPATASKSLRARARGGKHSVFEQVKWELWGNVFHQGTVYEVSPRTIPFLVEILRDGPARPDLRCFLLAYLAHLAIGYPQELFPDRFDEAIEAEAAEAEGETSWRLECIRGVERALPDVLPFIDSDDEDIALGAMAVVTWFPRAAAQTMPALLRVAKASDGMRAGSALVAAAHLERGPAVAAAAAERLNAEDPMLRVHAACAVMLACEGDDASAATAAVVLTEPLDDDLSETETPLAGAVGELVGRCLTMIPPAQRGAAIDALSRQLAGASPMTALSLAESMLELAFGEDDPPKRASRLTAEQRRAIAALAEHGPFELDGRNFGNFSMLLQDFDLPSTRDALARWLAK